MRLAPEGGSANAFTIGRAGLSCNACTFQVFRDFALMLLAHMLLAKRQDMWLQQLALGLCKFVCIALSVPSRRTHWRGALLQDLLVL